MGLDKKLHIPELYDMKHRNDKQSDEATNIEDNIYTKTLSGHLFENPILEQFILRLQRLTYIMFNQMYIMKNFKNFLVPKYDDKHID